MWIFYTQQMMFLCGSERQDFAPTIGRRSFEPGALKNNLLALLDALNKAKPAASKGVYLRKVAVSSTMGAGVRVDQNSLAA